MTIRLRFPVAATSRAANGLDITLRRATASDAALIMSSFNTVFGAERDANYWCWKFLRHDTASAVIAVDEHARVHGQFAAVRNRYLAAHGGNLVGGLGVDAFALRHTIAVQRRLFVRLVKLFFTPDGCLAEQDFTFGFPNDVAYGIYLHTVPLRYDFLIVPYARLVSDAEAGRNSPFRQPSLDDIDDLWSRIRPRYSFSIAKDSSWYRWRFLENPCASYGMIAIPGEGERLAAWAAVRKIGDTLVVVDMALAPDDDAAARRLDQALGNHAARENCSALLAIMPDWFAPLFTREGRAPSISEAGQERPTWQLAKDSAPIRFVLSDHHSAAFELGSRPWFSFADSDLY
jgi:hypothetical protein